MAFAREESGDNWGSDVPISEPVPTRKELKVTFDGFGFTMGGMTFDVSEEDMDDILRPIFQPEGFLDDDGQAPLVLTEDRWGGPEYG